MVEVIVKRKIIKKKKPKKPKKPIKKKPTQEQKQTQKQIINIYSSGALRNPLGIKRQKEKDRINPLAVPRIYRPVSVNQHVNSFEVEQRLYRKLADENRLSKLAQERERQNILRENKLKEAEIKRSQEKTQADMFNHIKNLEKKLDDSSRGQLERPNYSDFDKENSMGFSGGLEEKSTLEQHHESKKKEEEEKKEYFSNLPVKGIQFEQEPLIEEEDIKLPLEEIPGPDILSDEEISKKVAKNAYETLRSSKVSKLKEYAERYNEGRAEPFEFATNKKELVNQLFLKGIDIGTGPIKYVTFGEERSEADLRRL